jgi:hypothetical protein
MRSSPRHGWRLDGTKIHANASRHSALSYEHATKIEAQLKAEVAELLARAEAADQAEAIPEELARREERLVEAPFNTVIGVFLTHTGCLKKLLVRRSPIMDRFSNVRKAR